MSSGAYVPPTAQNQTMGYQPPKTFGGAQSADSAVTRYLCGDCGLKNVLKRSEPIRCKECGCRVLYKERTKRMVQFEAR